MEQRTMSHAHAVFNYVERAMVRLVPFRFDGFENLCTFCTFAMEDATWPRRPRTAVGIDPPLNLQFFRGPP